MSRGPGRWQAAILDTLDRRPAVVLTHPSHTTAEQVALRRAAYTLERAGRITLAVADVAGRPRLVAYRPGAPTPTNRAVTGLDGKRYRTTR